MCECFSFSSTSDLHIRDKFCIFFIIITLLLKLHLNLNPIDSRCCLNFLPLQETDHVSQLAADVCKHVLLQTMNCI